MSRILSSWWFKLALSGGLFTLLFWSIDLDDFREQLSAARLDLVVVTFLGYLLTQLLSAYKWQVLARPLGFHHPLRVFGVYYFVGMYLNLFMPSTIAGDVGRGLLLATRSGRVSALQSVLADRVTGVVMLLWVSALGFLCFGPTVFPATVAYGVVGVAVLTVAGWWIAPRVVSVLFTPGHAVHRVWENFFQPYHDQAGLLGYACLLSFGLHCLQLGLQVVLAYALHLSVPLWYLILFIPLVHILSALPVSFGGIGVRESSYVMFLALVGIGRHEAAAFGVLWSVLGLGAGLVGGVVLLLSPEVQHALARIRKKSDG
ncbi:MAG: flippase-like domain-containing protein [Deltaproteobacteria bacterium]|nr:flippase-like domain-containing protein [Deltaproteobacteria bacterium]